jgi:hypothetical protein
LGSTTAHASVYYASPNSVLSSAFTRNGLAAGTEIPNMGVNGPNSVFAHILAYLTPHAEPQGPQVLFEAAVPNNPNAIATVTIWPGSNSTGGSTATTIDTAGTRRKLSDRMFISVVVHGLGGVSSWVFGLEVWPIGLAMLLDMAINGVVDTGYGLSVNQYVQGANRQNPGYPINKTVQFGYSDAAPPSGPINTNVRGNAIPWGTMGPNGPVAQPALQVGGSLITPDTGLTQTSLHGFGLETNFSGNQIITAARLLGTSPSGTLQFNTPNLANGARLSDTFGVGASAAPVALFGDPDPDSLLYYFGNNQGFPTDFHTPPGGDTLTEDLSTHFSDD